MHSIRVQHRTNLRVNLPLLTLFLVFVTSFILYLLTLAPGMLRGDSGEFQWAMASLNVAHATGYPLFTLIGYVWQWVPLPIPIAWQLNLLAALFGALAVATIFVMVRDVTRRTDAALIAALFLALAPTIWFNASILEVYTLHAFLLALVIGLLWRWSGQTRGVSETPRVLSDDRALYLAFFVLGLALAHHRLIVLALPAIILFIFLTDRHFPLNLPRLLTCLLLLLPGLVLYLYVPLRLLPEGYPLNFAWNDIILGREYQGSLLREFNPLPVLWDIPFKNFHAGLVLAFIGALTLFRRARNLNILLWLVYLADLVFALVYSVPDIEVFLTSSFVVTAVWIGAGTAFVIEHITSALGARYLRPVSLVIALVISVVALSGLTRYDQIKLAVGNEAGTAETRARAILAAKLPEGAFLELDWETATAIRFLQTTEQARPDLEARLIAMNAKEEYQRALRNVDAGRAVFVERGVKWTRAPAGYSVMSSANDLAQVERAPVMLNPVKQKINDRVELQGIWRSADALTLYWRVQQSLDRDLATFVHYFDAAGNKIAQDDRAACCEAIYGYSTRDWEKGSLIADLFGSPPSNTQYVEIGMYELVNGDIEPYGATIRVELK